MRFLTCQPTQGPSLLCPGRRAGRLCSGPLALAAGGGHQPQHTAPAPPDGARRQAHSQRSRVLQGPRGRHGHHQGVHTRGRWGVMLLGASCLRGCGAALLRACTVGPSNQALQRALSLPALLPRLAGAHPARLQLRADRGRGRVCVHPRSACHHRRLPAVPPPSMLSSCAAAGSARPVC